MSQYQLERDEAIHVEGEVTVYRGQILPQGISVAIKEKRHSTIAEANTSLREGMCMRGLSHPNICRVYDCYIEEDTAGLVKTVLVVELLDRDLAREARQRRSENRPWTEQQLTTILQGLLSALSYAEAQGVSHRDLKPHNLLYGEVVKIADFGSATVLKEREFMYTLQGSPLYLSPELKRGYIHMLSTGEKTFNYDPIKSDVYSLGVTMLHLATLGPPDQLANLQSLDEVTATLIAGIPQYPMLQTVLGVMLAATPDARPSFQQLAELMIDPDSQQRVEVPAAVPPAVVPPAVVPPEVPVEPVEPAIEPVPAQQCIQEPPEKPMKILQKVEREVVRISKQVKRVLKRL